MKEATIHFYCLFDESRFLGICTIMELRQLNCVNIWKTSGAANLVFQRIFVLNSVKCKFFYVSIVNNKKIQANSRQLPNKKFFETQISKHKINK